jgi:hypothetical protein
MTPTALRSAAPWLVLWVALAVPAGVVLLRDRADQRRVASAATASASGRVVKEVEEQYEWVVVRYATYTAFFRKSGPQYIRDLHAGSDVTVYYDPANPGVATLENPRVERWRTVRDLITAFVIAGLVAAAVAGARGALRRRSSAPA